MFAIRENLCLQRQKCAARIDEINARQPILQRDLLCTQMLFDSDRKVGPALDGRVVRDDQALALLHASDAGDQAGARRFVVVHSIRRERRELEKRRIRIEQRRDPLAHRHLPLLFVALHVFRTATLPRFRNFALQLCDERLHPLAIGAEVGARCVEMRLQRLHLSVQPPDGWRRRQRKCACRAGKSPGYPWPSGWGCPAPE